MPGWERRFGAEVDVHIKVRQDTKGFPLQDREVFRQAYACPKPTARNPQARLGLVSGLHRARTQLQKEGQPAL